MGHKLFRKPFALANWKMAMTISETLAFVKRFVPLVETYSHFMDIVICPPHTAIHTLSRALAPTRIHVGAQDVCAAPDESHTGEVSPALAADAGCKWVMLGHWEVRSRYGESDADVNQKMAALLHWGLRPIILLGEQSRERDRAHKTLAARLPHLFKGCRPEQMASAVVVYEPEWTIGRKDPAPFQHISSTCDFLRRWIGEVYGSDTGESVQIIYGGSVTPAHSKSILASSHVDGLGAGRKGRDPEAFARIIRSIARAKGIAG